MELVKVVFQYSNGDRHYLEGDALLIWERFNSIVASSAANHGINPPWESIEWKKITDKKTEY